MYKCLYFCGMDKNVYQLFIGKVVDEIGMDKCSRLLKESSDCFKEHEKDFDALVSAINQGQSISLDDIYNKKITDVFIDVGNINGVKILSVKELEKGTYEFVYEQPEEKEFDALGAAIEQVNSIRFSPVQIISSFNTFSLDKIEKHIGMPQGYLSRAIKNKRALPKEWELALKKYLLNLAKNINEKIA